MPEKFIYVNHLTFDKPSDRVRNRMKLPHYLQAIALVASLSLLAGSASTQQKRSMAAQPVGHQQKLQSPALLFMENRGQLADDKGHLQPDILFTANSGGAKIYLTATGIHYQFSKTDYPEGYDPFSKEPAKDPKQEEALRQQIRSSTHRFTVALQGANLHPVISKQGQSRYYENYYLPQCPNGITGVQGYEKIIFKDVYPNIDWVVYGKGGFMEYDFLVHPGGNPANIKLKVKDAGKVSITSQGELLIQTTLGEVKEEAPVSFADGKIIPSRFKQNSDGTIGFAVQEQPGKELRIDPSIVWSTYYGGVDYDKGNSCRLDKNGYLYLAGLTASMAGIASGGFQTTYNGGFLAANYTDAFLVKFDTSGNRIWATYYGGTGSDNANGCAIDDAGNIYITGQTSSSSSMASGGFQNNYGGGYNDGFLAKFDPAGNRIWASYYGGSNEDAGVSCTVDDNNNLYVSGITSSSSAIAASGFQNTFGGYQDVFLAKFNSSGNRLWATYYGSPEFENLEFDRTCSVDRNGNVYLTGSAQATSGIASGGFQNTIGGSADAFLVKFNSNGNRIWATYYGGPYDDQGRSCTTDTAGNVYLSGTASPGGNLTESGFQNVHGGGYDAFLVKFGPAGNRLWGTYYGGLKNDFASACVVDTLNNVYMAGTTTSSNAIASNGFQNSFSDTVDAFIVKFTSTGARLWGSYYGGPGEEFQTSCDVKNGNIYLAGYTTSRSGTAYNGFQNVYAGGFSDAYLLKIGDITCISATQPTLVATADTICVGSSISLSIASGSLNSATNWQWRKDSCTGAVVGSGTNITVSPTVTTTYFVRGEGGCAAPGSCISKRIVVVPITTASVMLTANPSGPIIAGTTVTFTATATNGGSVPLYGFRVNNIAVQSGSSNVYTTNTLANGDIVEVLLSSNMPCVTNTFAIGAPITMIVTAPCIPPAIPTISTNYDTVCTGATPTLMVSSGNLNSATYWQWYAGSCSGTPIGNTSSITVTPAATTTYYLRGEGGCVTPGTCVSKTIYVKPAPVATFATAPTTLCAGDTLTVTFTGSAPPNATYNWNWGGGRIINGNGFGPYQVVYTAPGSIGLTVSNGTCSVYATVQNINPVPVPEIALSVSDSVGCAPQRITLSVASINGNRWTWDFGDGVTLSNVNTPVEHTYAAGTYMPSFTVYQGNCSNRATKPLRIYQRPIASFSVQPGPNTPVPLSQANFVFSNTSQGASRYFWRFGNSESSTLTDPIHRYITPGTYTVSLYAYSTGNCTDTFELKSLVIKGDTAAAFTIPTAFSPNGDGINDTWVIAALQQYSNCRVSIYNRWGQAVFASTGYTKPWDGKYNGKPLPVDTYYYVITLENKSYTGSVLLLR